ncbi:MAG: carboxylating nicotinate-nucleotide diphosphorylase [Acidimicrobiia bacterium]|nr:carboxylating nicotinate-nucleotide diphosphorylase [Acidimicrobiia bacterium]
MTELHHPPSHLIDAAIASALAEDFGLVGDITSHAVFNADHVSRASVVARRQGTVAGVAIASRVFTTVDPGISVEVLRHDGQRVDPGDVVLRISGSTRAILSAERVALNFAGRLSGIATLTASYVAEVADSSAAITDTRKTTPGLRALEKFAVRAGGGRNHRFGLNDAVMIKDNHVAAAGGIASAVNRVRESIGHTVRVEVEVDTIEQLVELLSVVEFVDIVLLDNMSLEQLEQAVRLVNGAMVTEASGGVTLATVKQIAATGVDLISVGALTHSATNFDLGLDF